jgi:tetratricopeptide (TPR) repeat protein
VFDSAQLEARIALCERVLADEMTGERLVVSGPAALARVEKGRALLELGRVDDAQRCLEDAVADFAAAGADVLVGRARADGVAGCDALIERLSRETAGSAELRVGHAMALKAWLLAERGREPQELAALDELLERFPASGEPELRARVALALREKAWWLLDVGDVPGALATGEELIARLVGETDPRVRHQIARALLRHASTLLHQNRAPRRLTIIGLTAATALGGALRDAVSPRVRFPGRLAALPATIGRVFGPVRERRHGQVAGARHAAAQAVRYRMLRHDQALKACDLLVARFANSSDPQEQRLVATAQVERATALLCLGRPRAGFSTMIRATESGEPAVSGFTDLAEQARRRRGPTTHVAAAAYDFARVLATDGLDDPHQSLSALNAFIERHEHERALHTRLSVLAARGLRRSASR